MLDSSYGGAKKKLDPCPLFRRINHRAPEKKKKSFTVLKSGGGVSSSYPVSVLYNCPCAQMALASTHKKIATYLRM